jgi:hypothetical protein
LSSKVGELVSASKPPGQKAVDIDVWKKLLLKYGKEKPKIEQEIAESIPQLII